MFDEPVKVPPVKVNSIDYSGWPAGLYLNGDQNAPPNAFVGSTNVELDVNALPGPRRVLLPFLPDTNEDGYQRLPVSWDGEDYFFTADDGKLKFCQEGDSSWTDCASSSEEEDTNTIVTNNGGKPKLMRALDAILVLNGTNGDKLMRIDLTTAGFPVIKYEAIADPASAPTATLTNLTAGSFKIYYAVSYETAVGETKLSPILTKSINIVRDQWQIQDDAASIKVTDPNTAPDGALFRNIYVAVAATAGTIQDSDMLRLASKLDLSSADFVDDGTLSIDLGSSPPLENSTDGPRVDQGIVTDGNPILYQDVDHPENIWIGGGGQNALSFSVSNGGYKAQPEQGTNFVPTMVIGFRNGQGVPSLTVLYSNTEGIAKQSILEQQTVNYGDQSFNVWGVTEQHYGAAGVAAPNSGVNYNGKLQFFSTDGILRMDTQPSKQNVLSVTSVSASRIDKLVRSINNEAMPEIIGTGWNNKFMWLIPNDGFLTPQKILILDDNNKVGDESAPYTLDIPAQWIGVISPKQKAAFVYIVQGKKTYKLIEGNSTYDTINGVPAPFSTSFKLPMLAVSGQAHNTWHAGVQVMFNILGLIGDITIGITYRNQGGRLKTKTKVYSGPVFVPSASGGWGDTGYTYAHFPIIAAGWGGMPSISDTVGTVEAKDVRIPLLVDDIFNEFQPFILTNSGYNYWKLKAVSSEGVDLGVRPDLQ